uniref:Putative secreted protein n=1 Tax=Anopheles triannulatus TaxID=58253 RepID=A0A2M4B301_9DIPT
MLALLALVTIIDVRAFSLRVILAPEATSVVTGEAAASVTLSAVAFGSSCTSAKGAFFSPRSGVCRRTSSKSGHCLNSW